MSTRATPKTAFPKAKKQPLQARRRRRCVTCSGDGRHHGAVCTTCGGSGRG